ncbi:MAG: hypothetical protein CMQ05_01735 [Gammaproteobacteria bacterium]|nr:hypothetical protein [Gammaproteobacteria bacterium]RPG26605.1 MAG: hypothetical protein CBC10_003525 [Gammaproteobacteria bacterium TMED50]|tara:strand:+ start:1006 stop:1410 length:405 start_codon:yes stop_codon:yes gene_type:complete
MPQIISMPELTLLYAAIFGLMSIVISSRAGFLRGKTKISIGDGGNAEVLLAMRRHANFVEYVPLALIIIALMEMNRAPDYAIHGLGGALIVARIAHALGLHQSKIMTGGRIAGAMLTALVTIAASIWSIVLFFQ